MLQHEQYEHNRSDPEGKTPQTLANRIKLPRYMMRTPTAKLRLPQQTNVHSVEHDQRIFNILNYSYVSAVSDASMPKGLTVVAVLTLLGAIGYFFTFIMLTALGAMGHAGQPTDPATMFRFHTLTFPSLALSFFSVVAVIGMFMRAKFGWYLSLLVWVSSIVYLVYVALSPFGTTLPLGDVFFAAIILVNIIFIEYFQSEKVKRYFKIKHPANVT